jgi:hypothetical protein
MGVEVKLLRRKPNPAFGQYVLRCATWRSGCGGQDPTGRAVSPLNVGFLQTRWEWNSKNQKSKSKTNEPTGGMANAMPPCSRRA